jgi:DNA-binding NarL/FixJ family response regulator
VRRSLLIVDDHDGFRRVAASLLAAANFEVLASVGTAEAALESAARLRPDAVLLDLQLPDAIGFDIVAALQRGGAVVVLTSSRSADDYGERISACGAEAFVAKDELSGAALHAIVNGPGGR